MMNYILPIGNLGKLITSDGDVSDWVITKELQLIPQNNHLLEIQDTDEALTPQLSQVYHYMSLGYLLFRLKSNKERIYYFATNNFTL